MADDPRKRTVQAGYDAMAEHYLAWGGEIEGDPRHRFLHEFARRLPDGARVLDLGCGGGIPRRSSWQSGSRLSALTSQKRNFVLRARMSPTPR